MGIISYEKLNVKLILTTDFTDLAQINYETGASGIGYYTGSLMTRVFSWSLKNATVTFVTGDS